MGDEKSDSPHETHHKGFLEELLGDVFNLDRGLSATIWTLIKSPDKVIDAHFTDRGKYVSPLRYCIFILAFTTFIFAQFIDYEVMLKGAMESGAGGSIEQMITQLSEIAPNFDWQKYFDSMQTISINLTQKFNQITYLILLAPLMAFFSKMFFKDKKEKFVHHYVMIVYTLTTFSLFSMLLMPIIIFGSLGTLGFVAMGTLPMVAFIIWGMVKYLGLKTFSEYLQAFIALVLGYICFSITTALIVYVGALIIVLL